MKTDRVIGFKTKKSGSREIDDGPEIPAKKNRAAVKIFDHIFNFVFKKYFGSVRVKNKHNYYLRNTDYPNIFYGFHGCWWDGLLGAFTCRKLYNSNLFMMIKDLYRFPLLSLIGGFSIEKDSVYGKLKAINYCIKLLENPENTLWIFPQGRVFPLNYRPVKFESGIAHICKRLKGVNLIPVAYKYTFLYDEKPEIFVEIGKPIIVQNDIGDKKEFLQRIERDFEKFLDTHDRDFLKEKFKEYEYISRNDFSWLKVIEKRLKPLVRARP